MVEKLAGRLDGSGRLSGGLLAPQVNGNLLLSGGEVSGPELPTTISDLQVQAQIAGENVQLNGSWKGGESGQGRLSGHIGWADALAVDIALKDLHITMHGDRLAIAGKVLVPKGEITVRELPPSTVKVSDDTVIVGNQTEEGKPPMAIAMDIDVIVGQDTLSFSGFGLTATLQGQVHIGDNLDTRGELRLNDGRYRAYGQRLSIRRARLLFADHADLLGTGDEPGTGVVLSGAGAPVEHHRRRQQHARPGGIGVGIDGQFVGNLEPGEEPRGPGLRTGYPGQRQQDGGGRQRQDHREAEPALWRRSVRTGQHHRLALSADLRYLLTKRVYLEAASGVASSLDIFYKRDF